MNQMRIIVRAIPDACHQLLGDADDLSGLLKTRVFAEACNQVFKTGMERIRFRNLSRPALQRLRHRFLLDCRLVGRGVGRGDFGNFLGAGQTGEQTFAEDGVDLGPVQPDRVDIQTDARRLVV